LPAPPPSVDSVLLLCTPVGLHWYFLFVCSQKSSNIETVSHSRVLIYNRD
jgi:hypothetical protein